MLVCSSFHHNAGGLFPIYKERLDNSKIIKSVCLIQTPENCKKMALEEEEPGSQLLSSFYKVSDRKEEILNYFGQVTSSQISLFDESMQVRHIISGLNLRGCLHKGSRYLYAIADSVNLPVTVTSYSADNNGEKRETEYEAFGPSGLYVYNTDTMFKGRIQKYKLMSTVGGHCSLLDDSKFGDRISLIQSYDNIIMIPLPHLNLLNCVGMGHKSEYLIWREKDGFFTALDKRSYLRTWSLITGKMLYREE